MSTATAGSAQPDAGNAVRAPLLETVLKGLDPDKRVFVIDLGGLRRPTLETFAAYRCRLDVLDLDPDDLLSSPQLAECVFSERVAAFERGLPELDSERADLLLCWSYLNYFSLEQLSLLMPILCSRLRPSGQIHALIESSAKAMPATPRSMTISSDGSLFWPCDSAEELRIPAPRHATDGLERCLPAFAIERTMLLGNGMKELIFLRS
jgi:hypothetical protein